MFWVISVYFNLRNIIPKSGTFPPGHPACVEKILFFSPARPKVPYFIEQIFVVHFTKRNCLYVPAANIDGRRGTDL